MFLTDTKNRIIAALAIVLLATWVTAAVFAYRATKQLREDDIASKADLAANQALQKQIDARDIADADQQKAAKVTESNIKTAADAVRIITKYVQVPGESSNAPADTVVIDKADLTAAQRSLLPDSPSFTFSTSAAAIANARRLVQCEADEKSLTTCKLDLTDTQTQAATFHKDADMWESAAKGGTKSRRLIKAGLCIASAAGGAYVGSVYGKAQGSAIGAVGAGTACQILFK